MSLLTWEHDVGNIKGIVWDLSATFQMPPSYEQTKDTKMLAVTVCILGLLHVSAACSLTGICTDLTSVQQEIVDVHNAYRRAVEPAASNMLKMSWSDAVAQSVQSWIDQCDMTHGPQSSRMIDGYEMGENLFKASTVLSWTDVIDAWHSEVKNYEYATGSTNGQATGHYTQVVWYSSYEVGCAVTQCGNSYFYGCQYYRAGNFKGVPPYSLGDPCAACPDDCEDGLCTNPCPYINTFRNCDELKETATCDHSFVSQWCPASCQCEDKIVPIAKK